MSAREAREQAAAVAASMIANGIRHLRIRRGLTQQGLAERCGMTQPMIARMEDPAYRGWTFRSLVRVANGLNARLRIRFVPRRAAREAREQERPT